VQFSWGEGSMEVEGNGFMAVGVRIFLQEGPEPNFAETWAPAPHRGQRTTKWGQ
jgi:hypothetical protein